MVKSRIKAFFIPLFPDLGMSRARRWCFTLNNPGDFRPKYDADHVRYMVYQLEAGENGTPHLQGYVRFDTPKRMSTVKTGLGSDALHLEVAKGTEEDNKRYCTKEPRLEQPVEQGTYDSEQGKKGRRTDLDQVATMLQTGTPMKRIAEEFATDYIRYHQGLEAFAQLIKPLPPARREVTVLVLWGPTATGKTHRVMTTYPLCYPVQPGRDPWGGYQDQEVVLFDEFDPSKWTIQEMNRFTDVWRCPLDCRYRNRYAQWKLVVICANSRPENWWADQSNSYLWSSFQRRITRTTAVLDIHQEVPLECPGLLPPSRVDSTTTILSNTGPNSPNPSPRSGAILICSRPPTPYPMDDENAHIL